MDVIEELLGREATRISTHIRVMLFEIETGLIHMATLMGGN